MSTEAKKVELYLLMLQSSTALLIALVNSSQTLRYDVQLIIKKRLLKLVKTLWEYLKDEADELETLPDPVDDRTLEPSRGFTDLSSEFRRSSHGNGQSRYSPLSSTLAGEPPTDAIRGTRFPLIHRLLTVLAQTPNDEIFTRTVQPFLHTPNFQQNLQQEMSAFRKMLAEDDPSLYLGEPALTERLDRMEMTMRRIMLQLNALAHTN